MKIISSQYTLKYKSFEIVHSGCDGVCDGCHSKELADFNLGVDWETLVPKIATKIVEFDSMIDWIWFYGGEPLLQDQKSLIKMICWLTSFRKPIMLFTRFEFNEVSNQIKMLVDYIKTGMYDNTQIEPTIYHGVTLATKNQKIWKKEGNEWI